MSKFGLLSKIEILQKIPSIIFANLNPAITHNLEKYKAIKKAFYISSIEEIHGDYFEFGVFTGSSFCHSIRCAKALEKYDKNLKNIIFLVMIHLKDLVKFQKMINTSSIQIRILGQVTKKQKKEF